MKNIMKKKNLLPVIMMAFAALMFHQSLDVYAAANTLIQTKVAILESLVSSIISSVGMIVSLWGIAEWGIAFQSNDGTMMPHALKRIIGGLIMIVAPTILTLIK